MKKRTFSLAQSDTSTRPARSTSGNVIESLLGAIGAPPALTDAVLGDLAEEYARRRAKNGGIAAGAWYVREALLSIPCLVRSAFGHGSTSDQLRLTAFLVAPAILIGAYLLRDGAPARLVADVPAGLEGIVINNVRPVQLPMLAFDNAGHRLEARGVRYQWISGAPIKVSPSGAVTCTERGNATVRATLGEAATQLEIWCRPVQELRAASWLDFVVGQPARRLPFVAIGSDSAEVLELRGSARVLDSSVATLEGTSVRPRAVGQTSVLLGVGDRGGRIDIIVHEPVHHFVPRREDQRFMAVPMRLEQGDTVHYALPIGVFWLKYFPRTEGEAPPTITVEGHVNCSPGDGLRLYRLVLEAYGAYCIASETDAHVTVSHGVTGASVVRGSLAVEWIQY